MVIVSLKTESAGRPPLPADARETTLQKAAEEISRIELSDGSLFSFRNCYLPHEIIETHIAAFDTTRENKITDFEEAAFRHASACLRTEKTALRLIARAEQCIAGLSRKLEKRGHGTACVNAVIERLCALQLLDDNRFARLWLESRLRLPRSPRRLIIALCSRGIDRKDADTAIKNVLDDDTEYSLLLRFAKKLAKKKKHDKNESRPLKYLLKNEGFSQTAIQRYMEEA